LFDRSRTIAVPGRLVPYVRSRLIAEFGSAIDVLEDALVADVLNQERWRAGLAQLDCARDLLGRIGLAPPVSGRDRDVTLEVSSAHARMLLDALRAIYDVEVNRLVDASTDRVHLPLRDLPKLRNFVVDVEKTLRRAARRQERYPDAPDKRQPRSVRITTRNRNSE
jgi:hypothetical protein